MRAASVPDLINGEGWIIPELIKIQGRKPNLGIAAQHVFALGFHINDGRCSGLSFIYR